ncbi:MAG: hypothetical protein AAFV25_08755 [Bacteroidota bacterium]
MIELYSAASIYRQQSSFGAFPSLVTVSDGELRDENCFVTSLVLWHLLQWGTEWHTPAYEECVCKALDFVAACEDPEMEGAFRYYPYTIDSPSLDIPLHNDLDDSSLALLVLWLGGRRNKEDIRAVLPTVFERHCKHWVSEKDPSWIAPGAAMTWINGRSHQNPVDACVNANVAALYAAMGLRDSPLYLSATESLRCLLRHWGDPALRWRQVAPYYAHPLELLYAMKRAVAAGADELNELVARMTSWGWAQTDRQNQWSPTRPICCNDHGRPLWYAPILQKVRKFFQHTKNDNLSW